MRAKAVALLHVPCQSCTFGRFDPVLRKKGSYPCQWVYVTCAVFHDIRLFENRPVSISLTRVQVYDVLRFSIRYNLLIARETKHFDPQATWRAQWTWIWHVRYPRSSTFQNKRPALEGLHDNPIQCVLYMYIFIYIYTHSSIDILSNSLHFSLSKLFVSRSDLALRTWYAFFGLLVAFATRTTPQQCVFWKVLVPWSVALNILDDDQTTQLNKKGGT